MVKKTIFLIAVIVAGIFLRVSLVDKPGYIFDVGSFVNWGHQMQSSGVAGFYANSYDGYQYPPVVPSLVAVTFSIFEKYSGETVLKYLTIVFDMILALITMFVIFRSKYEKKYLLTTLVAIQPAFALVGAGWGQVDSILATFLVLSAMLAIKHKYLATGLFIFCILVKPQAILAVVVYYLYILLSHGFKEFSRQAIFGAVLCAVAEILMRKFFKVSIWPFISGSVGAYQNLSLNAFNLWWAIYGHKSWEIKDTVGALVSFKSVGLGLFAVFVAPAIYYLKRIRKLEDLMLVMGYVYLAFFIFPSQIHERYMFVSLAFLAFAPLVDKKFFWPYVGLVASFLANIFAVLQSVYPQFEFLKFNLLIGDWSRLIAVLNVGICLYFFIWFVAKVTKNEKTKN